MRWRDMDEKEKDDAASAYALEGPDMDEETLLREATDHALDVARRQLERMNPQAAMIYLYEMAGMLLAEERHLIGRYRDEVVTNKCDCIGCMRLGQRSGHGHPSLCAEHAHEYFSGYRRGVGYPRISEEDE